MSSRASKSALVLALLLAGCEEQESVVEVGWIDFGGTRVPIEAPATVMDELIEIPVQITVQ